MGVAAGWAAALLPSAPRERARKRVCGFLLQGLFPPVDGILKKFLGETWEHLGPKSRFALNLFLSTYASAMIIIQ